VAALVVPASISLGRLHHVLQGAIGWTDSHLHLYRVAGRPVGPVDLDLGEPNADEDQISLGHVAGPGSVISYEYDFGDSREHTVEVLATLPGHPGRRAREAAAGDRAALTVRCGHSARHRGPRIRFGGAMLCMPW
jgi:hypothetical protein